MGEAMNQTVRFTIDMATGPVQASQATFRHAQLGRLPDAPLAMPTQILKQPSRVGMFLRSLFQRLPGHAET